ncbi:cilia- and flagella-associated protein 20-like isoform X6 [Dunckerocampus dactyliophorus]|uniref:cilia- and flagella-associated protein 20-like isoform X6 n=1 Tax=Dunckerocampus dactyliophorus TaxID=161453 RepID=UPI00240637F4|nr:cilia- and flagella-associated protein 20-like isoform X6 [Dunckerocampus dactyliophorus]
MFRSTFQGGFLSILYSIGSKPLQIWDTKVKNGHIKRVTDNDINSLVLEVEGSNVSTNYITCPADPRQTLGIKMPFLVMIVKKTRKYFSFEVQVLDDQNLRRRFRFQFNLADITRRAYGTSYVETQRVQIHANCRIRRVYFTDKQYTEDELPPEFKLVIPVKKQDASKKGGSRATPFPQT